MARVLNVNDWKNEKERQKKKHERREKFLLCYIDFLLVVDRVMLTKERLLSPAEVRDFERICKLYAAEFKLIGGVREALYDIRTYCKAYRQRKNL